MHSLYIIVLFLGYLFNTADAAAEEVDLQLVLAVDVSSSINYDEFGLQIRGYSAAFRNPKVQGAIASGVHKKIAVAMTQWAGLEQQAIVLDWTVIGSEGQAEAFADNIDYLSRAFPYGGTAIAPALTHAFKLFQASPHSAPRRIIDISGDGKVSIGRDPKAVRDRIIAAGVVVNGLPILNETPDLDKYFRENLIGGIGSFSQVSQGFTDFADAITRKMVREIRAEWYGV